MVLISEWVAEAGGLLHKRDLVRRGATDRDLTRAVREKDVRRVRRGWYTTFDPDDPRYRAVRVGGRLTGLMALRQYGAWMWSRNPPMLASVTRQASRLRRVKGVRVVYDPPRVARRGSLSVVDPRDALLRAILDESHETAVIAWDWASRSKLFTEAALDEVAALVPANKRGFLLWTDRGSDSIIESAARVRLLARGHEVVSQVRVRHESPIDLVIDGTVALELDGEEFHADSFEKDRAKDLAIATAGLMPLRAAYSMVRYAWSMIARAIDASLERHLRRPLDGMSRSRVRSGPPRVSAFTGSRRRSWHCPAPAYT